MEATPRNDCPRLCSVFASCTYSEVTNPAVCLCVAETSGAQRRPSTLSPGAALSLPGVGHSAFAFFCIKLCRYALMMWLPLYLTKACDVAPFVPDQGMRAHNTYGRGGNSHPPSSPFRSLRFFMLCADFSLMRPYPHHTHTPTSPAQIVGFPADTAGMLSLAFEIGLCNVAA
jgi:hypothetical protein